MKLGLPKTRFIWEVNDCDSENLQKNCYVAVKEYLEYWNHYRPHSGLGGAMVKPYPQDDDGEVVETSFLGGLLHGYRRVRNAA